jgi:hypothetical protein
MRSNEEKLKIIEALKEVPILRYALNKVQVPRQTHYRWMKNPKYSKLVEEAIEYGRSQTSDLAESHIVKRINEGDIRAGKYWLEHHSPHYKRRVEDKKEEKTEKEEIKVDPDGPLRLIDALKREFNFGKSMANIDINKLKIEVTARRAIRNMPPEGMAEEILFALTANKRLRQENSIT